MPYRLIESRAFERGRQVLNANARVSLPYALERIEDDPTAPFRRRIRSDGAIIDFGAEGLLIAYRILDSERVELLEVADVKREHRW